jgi:energy-coupling factor transporter transmembrane protein EcfT
MKRAVPTLIAAIAGFVLVIAFFIPSTQSWGEKAVVWFNILAGVAFVLGGGNLVKVQLETISSRRKGYGYAAVTLIAFFAMLSFGLFKIGVHPQAQYPLHPWAGAHDAPSSPFGWMYDYVFSPITATMFASLAFYVASAAFRAFRAKNIEAILLLATAFLVLIGNTAIARITDALPEQLAFLRLDSIVANLMTYLSTGAWRAITIGIAVGVAATSMRVLLGIDRPYLGRA